MAVIQEDSFWWHDTSLPEEEQCMRGLCVKCATERGIGMFWPGKRMGYGNYDLNCFLCNTPIYLRDKESDVEHQETKTTNKDSRW